MLPAYIIGTIPYKERHLVKSAEVNFERELKEDIQMRHALKALLSGVAVVPGMGLGGRIGLALGSRISPLLGILGAGGGIALGGGVPIALALHYWNKAQNAGKELYKPRALPSVNTQRNT